MSPIPVKIVALAGSVLTFIRFSILVGLGPDNVSDNRAAGLQLASRIVAGKMGACDQPAEIRKLPRQRGFAFIALLFDDFLLSFVGLLRGPVFVRGDTDRRHCTAPKSNRLVLSKIEITFVNGIPVLTLPICFQHEV